MTVTICDWTWAHRDEENIEGEWQLTAEYGPFAKTIWLFGAEDDKPSQAITEHLSRVLLDAVEHEWGMK